MVTLVVASNYLRQNHVYYIHLKCSIFPIKKKIISQKPDAVEVNTSKLALLQPVPPSLPLPHTIEIVDDDAQRLGNCSAS